MSGDQQLIALVGVVLVIVVAVTVYRPYLQAIIFGAPAAPSKTPLIDRYPAYGPHYGRFGVPNLPGIA